MDQLFTDQPKYVKKTEVKENERTTLNFAGNILPVRQSDGYDPVPSCNWHLVINYLDNRKLVIPLTLDILGAKGDYC